MCNVNQPVKLISTVPLPPYTLYPIPYIPYTLYTIPYTLYHILYTIYTIPSCCRLAVLSCDHTYALSIYLSCDYTYALSSYLSCDHTYALSSYLSCDYAYALPSYLSCDHTYDLKLSVGNAHASMMPNIDTPRHMLPSHTLYRWIPIISSFCRNYYLRGCTAANRTTG